MPSILVIEDDNVMQIILQAVLQKQGYTVSIAQNDHQAFDLLNQQHFDLIITDLMLPFNGGPELLRKLKTDPDQKNIPVIAISSDVKEKSVQEAFATGADHFLRKPCPPGELFSCIQRLLTIKPVPVKHLIS